VVSAHSAREKSIRHGHPSTLHLWWARRPLAACRAMLMALLLPDPGDPLCPADFKAKARELLPQCTGAVGPRDEDLRKALLKFIGDFANWDNAANGHYLDVSRGLVKAAHPEETPLVVDPFAGGGSIPLEALRLGCDAFASDLNPVACLILKTMLEDIPRHGPELADELRRVGKEIKQAAEKELAELYPEDPDGGRPIAYLWARTVRCEAPNCGAEIPLMRSFWLCKKANRKRALRIVATKWTGDKKEPPELHFSIFEPKRGDELIPGTVSRAKARCPACGSVLSPDRVRAQLREQRGGADVIFDKKGERIGGARLLAVVTLKEGETGRQYRVANRRDYGAVRKAHEALKGFAEKPLADGLSAVPDEPLPPQGTLGFRVQLYGMTTWGDLFTARQKVALCSVCCAAGGAAQEQSRNSAALSVSKLTELACSLCAWEPAAECPRHVFGKQTLQITWDFAEGVLTSESSGSYTTCVENNAKGIESVTGLGGHTSPQVADAVKHPLTNESTSVWFTDPPYYDAIPYSDLSDFFFVWLRRVMPGHPLLRDPFDSNNRLTPKDREAVQDEVKKVNGRSKDRAFFEETMAKAFAEGRRILREDGIGSVVFAHKTTEGWEALLSGMMRGGWTITGSWPIATEMGSRLRARDSAALGTSVHLVCRPRTEDKTGDWQTVLRELPPRVRDWMERLQAEHVRGADLVFACIGPALEIYSRYARVEDAEGREIPLGGDPEATEPHQRGYLAYVWEAVGRAALEQILGGAESKARNGAAGALEEDARLTALFLWTLQATNGKASATEDTENPEKDEDDTEGGEGDDEAEAGPKKKKAGFSLIYDVARRFAQPLGIHLDAWEGRVIETDKGVVRLLPVAERAKQLFGEEDARSIAQKLENATTGPLQGVLFPEMVNQPPQIMARGKKGQRRAKGQDAPDEPPVKRQPTTLDRVHAAMLLQASGQTNALRALLKAERDRGPDFLRLANALSALYPKGCEEKRLLDAMLLAAPR